MNKLLKNKGRILFITKSDQRRGSSRYRAFQVMSRLKEKGWSVSLGYICRTNLFPQKWWFYPNFILTALKILLNKADLVYFQRADRRWKKTKIIATLCNLLNVKTIFDIDDEINWDKSHATKKLIEKSNAVIVASHALYKDVKSLKSKTYLLQTPFNEKIYKSEKKKNVNHKIICGFVGDGRVYFQGLKTIFASLNLLREDIKDRLKIVYLGDNIQAVEEMIKSTCHGIDLEIIRLFDWSNEISLVEILSNWHIGFTPKRIDPKGGAFKTIQYLALNIIPIASQLGENCYFIKHRVNGFLVKDETEWKHYVQEIVENPQLRIKISQNGHSAVERFSLYNYTKILDNIFEELIFDET